MNRALPTLAVLAVLAVGSEALAASFTLTDADRRAAIRTGERSVTSETFDGEWRVTNGGGETATVLTPFHRLMVAARHAAFKNEPLKLNEVDRVLKENAGRLVVWVSLRGRSEEFARFYVPRLVAAEREIRASFVQNERTASRQEDGAYMARCVYGFPIQELTGRARVALVVADSDGHDVSRFTIDLAGMR
ncbi:MAG: hypothetical protein DMD78_05820 [Candidatus Rokuibacteriota bacterium]|nr:MAG: hypothetical protein DMD78_05820 [Candidatus Rokubacteria bacterium]